MYHLPTYRSNLRRVSKDCWRDDKAWQRSFIIASIWSYYSIGEGGGGRGIWKERKDDETCTFVCYVTLLCVVDGEALRIYVLRLSICSCQLQLPACTNIRTYSSARMTDWSQPLLTVSSLTCLLNSSKSKSKSDFRWSRISYGFFLRVVTARLNRLWKASIPSMCDSPKLA